MLLSFMNFVLNTVPLLIVAVMEMLCVLLLDCDVQLVGLIKMLIVPEPIVAPSDTAADETTTTVSLSICLFVYQPSHYNWVWLSTP